MGDGLRSVRRRQFGISDREREILELLLDGKGDKEIGFLLGISYHTVRSHISKIFKKCGAQNRIELLKVFQSDKPFRGPASRRNQAPDSLSP